MTLKRRSFFAIIGSVIPAWCKVGVFAKLAPPVTFKPIALKTEDTFGIPIFANKTLRGIALSYKSGDAPVIVETSIDDTLVHRARLRGFPNGGEASFNFDRRYSGRSVRIVIKSTSGPVQISTVTPKSSDYKRSDHGKYSHNLYSPHSPLV